MKAGFSYLWACVFKKPETNLENFYINRFGKVLYSMFFEAIPKSLGQTPKRDIRRLGLTACKRPLYHSPPERYVQKGVRHKE